jgi:hypothetical protein
MIIEEYEQWRLIGKLRQTRDPERALDHGSKRSDTF